VGRQVVEGGTELLLGDTDIFGGGIRRSAHQGLPPIENERTNPEDQPTTANEHCGELDWTVAVRALHIK